MSYHLSMHGMVKIVASTYLFSNAVYLSTCSTKYLLSSTPVQSGKTVTEKLELELAVNSLITIVSDDLFSHNKAFSM